MIFAHIILTILSSIGVFYIIQLFFERLYRQKETCCKPMLVWKVSSNSRSDLEMDIKLAVSGMKWINIKNIDNICFVNCNLNESDTALCERVFNNLDYNFLNKSNINEIF